MEQYADKSSVRATILVFYVSNWTLDFPSTKVTPLARPTLDHVPCRISIEMRIPKSNIFQFENFWASHSSFLSTVGHSWNQISGNTSNIVSVLSAKFKKLRYDLKQWSKGISNIRLLIENCNKFILYLDTVEEFRQLFNPEWNVRTIIKQHLCNLLKQQNTYWK